MAQRGVVLATVPPVTADAIDYLMQRYGITQEEVINASVAVLSSMVSNQADPGHGRALKFMDMVREDSRKRRGSLEVLASREVV